MRPLFSIKFPFATVFFTISLQVVSVGAVNSAELPSFADLVEKNGPTIVEISTSRQVEARSPVDDQELIDLL